MSRTLLRVEHLVVEHPASGGRRVHAVSDVSFDLAEGETLGLVGESGCGKSTLSRAILQAPRPTAGCVIFDGVELTALAEGEVRRLRPKMQLITQDPVSALNPRRRAASIVSEPLDIWRQGNKEERRARVAAALEAVGLDIASIGGRRPFEFSGGQCQRLSIARALVMEPQLLVCDEPVASLDVSVRSQIIALMEAARARYGLSMLFVGHDLAVVKNVSDRVAVMYLGKLCELAPADHLYEHPAHPYTSALLASTPEPAVPEAWRPRRRPVLHGELPSPLDPPSGCRFRTRCPSATVECSAEEPTLQPVAPGHLVACHHPLWAQGREQQPAARGTPGDGSTP